MRRRLVLFLACFEALVIAAAVYLEPTCCVRGTLRREAFFDGRPTTYWNHELERWHVKYIDIGRFDQPPSKDILRVFDREYSAFERWHARWFGEDETGRHPFDGPIILDSRDTARPVLEELMQVGSPKVRTLANIGLGIDPNLTR